MLDASSVPNSVSDDARSAIINHADRVDRAAAAGDIEQIVGTSKDLVECVCKVAIETLGGTYGSNEKLPKLAGEALSALNAHPSGFQGRQPVQEFTQALAKVPEAVSKLRNRDGTGHGRTQPTDLHEDTAAFVQEVAVAWSRWVLAALGRVLADMSELDEAVHAIEGGGAAFRRGELRSLLDELHLQQLEPEQQRRLGVAIGRRWAGRTFMVRLDVIEPFLAGESFPEPFAVGLIEGSFIDANGYIRTNVRCALDAAEVAVHLGELGADTMTELADKLRSAEFSYAFREQESSPVGRPLRNVARSTANDRLRQALLHVAARIEEGEEYEE